MNTLSKNSSMTKRINTLMTLPILIIVGLSLLPSQARANDTPFIGEVRMFGGNYAPAGYVFCDGQTLPISQYSALFSILGTTYGGDGRTNFAVPDLRGRTPIGPGTGPGLSSRSLGQKLGVEAVTLTDNQLGNHNHSLIATTDMATDTSPNEKLAASSPGLLGTRIYADDAPDSTMNAAAIDEAPTAVQPHNNMQPYLGLNYIIAVQGVFPSRN